jgi:hypothetical protein
MTHSQDIQSHEPTIVTIEKDGRPSLDWDRLRDANDDYDEILITPNGRLDYQQGYNDE